TADHNAFNASCLAVLNVSRDSMASNGYSPATRVFEAAGAGACLITDAWEGIDRFFAPGSEILVAENGPAVAEHLARLSPADARRIGAAAPLAERARRRRSSDSGFLRPGRDRRRAAGPRCRARCHRLL